VVLNRKGRVPQGGVKKFPGGCEPLHVLQLGKFLNGNVSFPNVAPVIILRRYMLFCFFSVEVEVGVKLLKMLQAEFEPAYKHSGAQLGGLFSLHAKPSGNSR